MKLKDIAYILENVRELIYYEKDNGRINRIIRPVYNAFSGESKSYFDYEVTKIDTKIVVDKTMLDTELSAQAILVVYLEKGE